MTWQRAGACQGNHNCVEVTALWQKASSETTCVEVAPLGRVIGIRDSKHPGAGHLHVGPDAFHTLLAGIKERS